MQRTLRWLAISLPLVAVVVLLVLAASNSFFFISQRLTPATAVFIEGEGFDFHFYRDNSNAVTVVNVFHSVGEPAHGHSRVVIEVTPHERYQIDTLRLEISQLVPPQALTITEADFEYERIDYEEAVAFVVNGTDIQLGQKLRFVCDLDVGSLDAATPDKVSLFIAVTAYENSVLKLVKYSGSSTIQIQVPALD
jgi:hypothetical protein